MYLCVLMCLCACVCGFTFLMSCLWRKGWFVTLEFNQNQTASHIFMYTQTFLRRKILSVVDMNRCLDMCVYLQMLFVSFRFVQVKCFHVLHISIAPLIGCDSVS